MFVPRAYHTATWLNPQVAQGEFAGQILMAGGWNGDSVNATAEYFDPSGQTFVPASRMTTARAYQAAVLMPNGRVLIAGGQQAQSGEAIRSLVSVQIHAGPRRLVGRTAEISQRRRRGDRNVPPFTYGHDQFMQAPPRAGQTEPNLQHPVGKVGCFCNVKPVRGDRAGRAICEEELKEDFQGTRPPGSRWGPEREVTPCLRPGRPKRQAEFHLVSRTRGVGAIQVLGHCEHRVRCPRREGLP
jgi:hypothetical protein